MKGNRGERLSSQFREEISKVISYDLRNKYPSLSAIISVTEVDVAADLKTAKAYVSVYDVDADRKRASFDIISKNAGYIRHSLSKVLNIRMVPEIHFIFDDSFEYGDKIDKLLKNIETSGGNEDGE